MSGRACTLDPVPSLHGDANRFAWSVAASDREQVRDLQGSDRWCPRCCGSHCQHHLVRRAYVSGRSLCRHLNCDLGHADRQRDWWRIGRGRDGDADFHRCNPDIRRDALWAWSLPLGALLPVRSLLRGRRLLGRNRLAFDRGWLSPANGGEMGFFRESSRSATVSSDGPVTLYTLTRFNFEKMRRERPDLAIAFDDFIMRVLADRIEFAGRQVASLSR
jgi:hypothetical protein